MPEERVLWEAEFDERAALYWLLSGALIMVITVVGICVLPIWFVVGFAITNKYLQSHRCTLTNRSLKFSRGILTRMEKTVPLDRITDVGLVQGPIMRMLNIEALSVETAGQSSQGALVQLVGVKEGRKFRDAVLEQRDRVVGSEEDRTTTAAVVSTSGEAVDNTALLKEIHATLLRIEERIRPSDN